MTSATAIDYHALIGFLTDCLAWERNERGMPPRTVNALQAIVNDCADILTTNPYDFSGLFAQRTLRRLATLYAQAPGWREMWRMP